MDDDTSPEAMAVLCDGFRRMAPEERLARVFSLRRTALGLARIGLEARHGPLSEREAQLRLASTWLDRETMIRAFRWDPDEK